MKNKFETFGRFLDRCESPIEQKFLVGLLFLGDTTFEPFEHDHVIARDSTGVEIGMQLRVRRYRLDFTLSRCGVQNKRFAIEIDGHVHHGATPDQFARDKARERDLVSMGWTVLRFAGLEVHREPQRCAREAMARASVLVSDDPPAASPCDSHLSFPMDPELAKLGRMAEAETDWTKKMRLLTEAAQIARGKAFPSQKTGCGNA